MLTTESQILSEITTHLKYAKFVPEKHRRETWDELVTRNKEMHIKKFPQLAEEIAECKIDGGLPHAVNWRLSAKVLQAKLKEKNT